MSQPLTIDELIGNDSIKTQVKVAFGAAKLHNRPIGHALLTGQAGCGKTSTAQALARMGRTNFVQISPEGIKTSEDLARVFDKFSDEGYNLESGEIIGSIKPTILFIDEAHQLSLKAEEMLGIAMENFRHSYSRGRGKKKELVHTWIPKFTLIAATTKEGELSKPFRDRFKHIFIFSSYTQEESEKIVVLHANKMGLRISEGAIKAIARRGRGTPRVIVRYLERMYDSISVLGRDTITEDVVEAQFQLLQIDDIGLTEQDTTILQLLNESESAVGLETLAVRTNQDPKTVSDVNEPYLLKLGFIERSPRGRIITERGINHLIQIGLIKGKIDDKPRRAIFVEKGGMNG